MNDKIIAHSQVFEWEIMVVLVGVWIYSVFEREVDVEFEDFGIAFKLLIGGVHPHLHLPILLILLPTFPIKSDIKILSSITLMIVILD